MRGLQLERPICFFDLETTSAEAATARIIEICVVKLYPNGKRSTQRWLLDPQCEISESASAVHGYTTSDLLGLPTFADIAPYLFGMLKGCDLGGFRSNKFDLPILFYEFDRAGLHYDYTKVDAIDAGVIFQREEPRTLTAAYKFYTGKSLEGAHEAEADINATIDVLEAQYEKYPGLPRTVKELAFYSNYEKEVIDLGGKFARDADGDIIFTFGKNKDKKAKADRSYLLWMQSGDFTADVKVVVSKLLAGTNV